MEAVVANILVVEDEPAVRGVVEQTMIRSGHSVITAEDGFDALKKLSLGHIDLVITDLVMPEMDGVKLIGHIRERYPNVKVIAISGGGINHTPQDCLGMAVKVGAVRTLMKPFMLNELSSMTTELLGDASAKTLGATEDE